MTTKKLLTIKEKYTAINMTVKVKDQLADIAKRHNASISLLIECLLQIDDNALSELIDKTKQARLTSKQARLTSKREMISKLAKLPPEELQRLLDSSGSS